MTFLVLIVDTLGGECLNRFFFSGLVVIFRAAVFQTERPGATPLGGLHVGRPFGRTASCQNGEVATASRTGGAAMGRVEMCVPCLGFA